MLIHFPPSIFLMFHVGYQSADVRALQDIVVGQLPITEKWNFPIL